MAKRRDCDENDLFRDTPQYSNKKLKITITVSKSGFSVIGHASWARHGKDIVCSAVSAITQTIASGMEKYCNSKITAYPGSLVVQTNSPNQETNVLLTTLKMGLQQIQKEYPEYLILKEVEL